MARIAGMATFTLNGRAFSTSGEFDIKIQGVAREAIPSSDGQIHYSEMLIPDTISGDLLLTPDLRFSDITSFTNGTIQVQLKKDGSQSVAILKNAFFTGDSSVTTTDGKMKVEFSGQGRWA
jgi:hypothetical protein